MNPNGTYSSEVTITEEWKDDEVEIRMVIVSDRHPGLKLGNSQRLSRGLIESGLLDIPDMTIQRMMFELLAQSRQGRESCETPNGA